MILIEKGKANYPHLIRGGSFLNPTQFLMKLFLEELISPFVEAGVFLLGFRKN
jgi:hypothetical protein